MKLSTKNQIVIPREIRNALKVKAGDKLGTRKFMLRRFPYSVVYRMTTTAVQIIAVVHGRRRPGYWRMRRLQSN